MLEITTVSDALILPTGLSLDDLLKPSSSLARGLRCSTASPPTSAFVLCRLVTAKTKSQKARAYIVQAGYQVFEGKLPDQMGSGRNQGRAPSETTHPSLRERAERLAQSVIDFVTGRVRGTESKAEVQ